MLVVNNRVSDVENKPTLYYATITSMTFTFSGTMPIGDYELAIDALRGNKADPMAYATATISGDSITFQLNTKTENFKKRSLLTQNVWVEIYKGDVLYLQDQFICQARAIDSATPPIPPGELPSYVKTIDTKVKPEVQFSSDGEEWSATQELTTKYFRFRNTIAENSLWSDAIFISNIDLTDYALKTYVDDQDEAVLQNAKDYTDEKVGQFQNLFFYITSSTSATNGTAVLNVKPTGAGTVVDAWDGPLTTTLRQVYGFQYITENDFTLMPNSPITVVVPYRNLQTNKAYYAQYITTIQHTSLNSGNPITMFDLMRGPTTPNNPTYDVEFTTVNNQTEELLLPAGTALYFKIFARTSLTTATMSILVNDSQNTMLISRSERVGQTSATSIITNARGEPQSVENVLDYVIVSLGTYEDVLDYLINGGN